MIGDEIEAGKNGKEGAHSRPPLEKNRGTGIILHGIMEILKGEKCHVPSTLLYHDQIKKPEV